MKMDKNQRGLIINNKVSIILLNWNGEEDTIECLESLKSVNYPKFDVYLVDNGSKKRSVDSIMNYLLTDNYYSTKIVTNKELNDFNKTNDINLVFILNETNSGFAGGNNIALNYLSTHDVTDYILLLNNDTIVSTDFLSALVETYDENEDTGFVGINHYYYHNKDKLQTVGGGMVDLVHGEASAITDINQKEGFDFLTGSCILMSKKVLQEAGVLNEDYFMYWEDVDWSTRVRNKGYQLRVADRGCIYHKEGASIKSLSRIYYHTRNRILYMKRYTKGSGYYKFIVYIILYVLKESFSNIFKDKEYSKVMLKGLKDGLLKRG
ncbi:MAG: glycosyltransferase family 2 protein [Methanosphaera sp.]|nr:glycosyltransferase family 2 protein [Methanosphaera sp.]